MSRPNIEEFSEIADALEKRLSLRCIGFDPGFLMRDANGSNTVDIPHWLAQRILMSSNAVTAGESNGR